jgi:hypothetical protein
MRVAKSKQLVRQATSEQHGRRLSTQEDLEALIHNEVGDRMFGIFVDDLYNTGISEGEQFGDKMTLFTTLDTYRPMIKLAFRYYLLHGMSKVEKTTHAINGTQWRQFCRDCKVTDVHRAELIFRSVTKNAALDVFGKIQAVRVSETSANELNMVQFVAGMMRVAKAQYPEEFGVSRSFKLFLQNNFLPYGRKFEHDQFREKVYKNTIVQHVLSACRAELQQAFIQIALADLDVQTASKTRRPQADSMNVQRFFAFMKEAALLDHHLSVPRALEVFMQCNFAPEDADGWADWDWELEYVEFEEALTRLALIKMKAEHSTLQQVWP